MSTISKLIKRDVSSFQGLEGEENGERLLRDMGIFFGGG
jgi:hypothetical protein